MPVSTVVAAAARLFDCPFGPKLVRVYGCATTNRVCGRAGVRVCGCAGVRVCGVWVVL